MDVHIHGYLGEDTSDRSAEGIRKMAGGIVKNGVTSWCPTTMTVSMEEINAALNAVRSLKEESKDWEGAEITGEPILRNMEYNYPNCGYAKITDQFMLEDKYLVAPVLEKGARERKVVLPEGKWLCDDDKVYEGGEYVIPAPLDRLVYFKKI